MPGAPSRKRARRIDSPRDLVYKGGLKEVPMTGQLKLKGDTIEALKRTASTSSHGSPG